MEIINPGKKTKMETGGHIMAKYVLGLLLVVLMLLWALPMACAEG